MTARIFTASGEPAYMFHFGYVPPAMRERARFGAGHGSDVPYVFGTLNSRWGAAEPTSEEEKLAKIMNSYWTNFAKTGDPNGEKLPDWPLYDTQKEEILDIELDGNPFGKPDHRKARLNVIEKAAEKYKTRLQSRGI
jgi:para-nitrobenzyl esterase